MNFASFAPAFVAAEAGYDVWLGNFRGNSHAMRHIKLNPIEDAAEFFDFDISHHSEDLRTMITYIKA